MQNRRRAGSMNETDCAGFLLHQALGVKRSALSEQAFEEYQQVVPELGEDAGFIYRFKCDQRFLD